MNVWIGLRGRYREHHDRVQGWNDQLCHYKGISISLLVWHELTYVDVEVKARMPRMGQPSSRAVLADITMCTPTP